MEKEEELLKNMFSYVKNELKLPVEQIGTWLWVDCTSASKKKLLEEKGFIYSKSRFMFYYRIQKQAPIRFYRKPIDMDELRKIYNKSSQLTIKS